ncbi:putative non-specific serine/threonine protein kinase [Helianthus annuus]|uniref:Non-specific serine/threonine protein kinase n=1 Tax=Helianthus annuus TaxID=4232 RepID=A0A251RZH7_HELAN|nr:putative non-specific serine/threonine protein kinase [Helianthus annuus]KAJ0443239.1 putative non-specific serine/threonine protein kinase [Helianthus annuus]KAJ0460804.1 putative non-specific serine/threonine protein kinase [Helianthus annuus]KAJ0641223.1 putative non-specific serine/threonine protein kinase [Helianthus annuus]KAJ0645135.1 putative non-specific serine/threonine protein kinase [Helianthus annuus]
MDPWGTSDPYVVLQLDTQIVKSNIKREIATLKILKHPNVVRLHETLLRLQEFLKWLIKKGQTRARFAEMFKCLLTTVNKKAKQMGQNVLYCCTSFPFWLFDKLYLNTYLCKTNFILAFNDAMELSEWVSLFLRYNKERKLRTNMNVPCHMPSLTKYISFKGDKKCRLIGLGNGSNMFGLTRVTF